MVNKLLDLYLRYAKGFEMSQCPTLNYQGATAESLQSISNVVLVGRGHCPMQGGVLSRVGRECCDPAPVLGECFSAHWWEVGSRGQ